MQQAIQTALRLIYPARCSLCSERVESDFGLCGRCWGETPFISGAVCNYCGVPLPGDDPDEGASCDDCLRTPRPWDKGRASLLYQDNARKLVLALKHGDRHDIVRPAALWLARSAASLVDDNTLVVPIPLHWTRMLRRRFNQSALLARAMAAELGLNCCPDYLVRCKRTACLDGLGVDERFSALNEAITLNPARTDEGRGKTILLVDDVMTSGANLSAATWACQGSGASRVRVLVLARVAKRP